MSEYEQDPDKFNKDLPIILSHRLRGDVYTVTDASGITT
jgi:hypothetical protein